METILGQTIHDAVIRIDNKIFINCELANCTLEYAGEPVSFQVTRLRHCKYVFYGSAKRTVMFLQETGLMPFDQRDWGEFNEDARQHGANHDGARLQAAEGSQASSQAGAQTGSDGHAGSDGHVDGDGHTTNDGHADGRGRSGSN